MWKKFKFASTNMQESAKQKHMLMQSWIQEDKIAYGIENISLSFFLPDIFIRIFKFPDKSVTLKIYIRCPWFFKSEKYCKLTSDLTWKKGKSGEHFLIRKSRDFAAEYG